MLSKSTFVVKVLAFGIWILFVNITVYSFAEFINYRITGYNTVNFFETQSLIYSVLKVLLAVQPMWVILSFPVVLVLELSVFKLMSKFSENTGWVVRIALLFLSIGISFSVDSFYGFVLSSIYLLVIYAGTLHDDVKLYVNEKGVAQKINMGIGIFAYSILLLGGVMCCMWHATQSHERSKLDFTRIVCGNLRVVTVLDKSNIKHVGWHLSSDDDFITLKEKIRDNFYELVSISNSEVRSVQSFSLDFKAEKEKAFLECRDI